VHNNRFTVEYVGLYTVEYDKADNSLRLSWPGGQLFMDANEARALLSFLQQVHPHPYEDTARYETEYGYLEGTDAAWHV